MCSQLMEPEVTLTDVIRRHVEMGLAVADAFSAEQRKELKRYSKISVANNKKKHSKMSKTARKGGCDISGGSNSSGSSHDEIPQTIPFKTLSFLHETLKEHFKDDTKEEREDASRPCAYLHELLRGSSLHIPELRKPERNPVLEARCQRLRLQQRENEYQNMVRIECDRATA